MLKTITIRNILMSTTVTIIFFVATPMLGTSHAATSCNTMGYASTIGTEVVAVSCVPNGMDDNTYLYYKHRNYQCVNGIVTMTAEGITEYTSLLNILNSRASIKYRDFRNKEGTYLFSVTSSYRGTIDGKPMSSYPTGAMYTDIFTKPFDQSLPSLDCQGGDFNNSPMELCGNSTINMGTGRLSHSQQIFATKSTQPLALNVSMNYRSIQFAPGAIGNGWSHSYEMSLKNGAGNSKIFWIDGARRIYENYTGIYISPEGDYSTLVLNGDSTFTITEKNGLKRNFDAAGNATSIMDRNSNMLTFGYTNGKLTNVTDPNGRSATFGYDGSGKLVTVTDPKGNVYTMAYTGGNLTSVTHPDSGQWVYTYGSNGLLASKRDPENNLVAYSYDSNNRMTSSNDPVGKNRSYSFPPPATNSGKLPDPYHRTDTFVVPPKQITFTEKDGNGWSYSYDTLSATITSKTDPLGNTTSYTYDMQGNILTKAEPGIGTTTYTYDAKGNVLTLKDPINQTTTFTYNNFGQILTVTGAPGTTINTYDTKGNLLTTTDPAGAFTQYRYDSKGNLDRITDARNKVTDLVYNTANSLTSIILPTTAFIQLTYDANGNLSATTDANNKITTTAFNPNNQLASITDPLNKVTRYTYDKNGNPTTVTDANNRTTTYTYNYQSQLVGVKDALDKVTSFTYGLASCPSCTGVDQLTALTDARNQKTSWSYDKLGRMISETTPLNTNTFFTYGQTKSPIAKTDANNIATNYTFDNLQRLTTKTFPNTTTETYGYDSRNNILTAANTDISYTFTYDSANRIKTATDSRGYSLAYDYDVAGNRIKMTLQPGTADERITTYIPDDGNRLGSMATTAGTFNYGYDLNNKRTSLLYPNQAAITYGYDDAGRLTALNHVGIASFSYTLDDTGNRAGKSTGEAEQYLYDLVYRLTNVTNVQKPENFQYDDVGNRTLGPGAKDGGYSHDAENRMIQGRKLSYGYDNNGNQATKTVPNAPDKSWTQTWDYENRLIKVEKAKGAEKRTITFKYDPFGRRIEKKLTTIIDGTTKIATWTYVYDNSNIALEIYTDENNSTEKTWYTHGAWTDEHLAMERNGQHYYFHADGLGSVAAITDQSKAVVQTYEYDSFGMVKPSTGFRNSYTYTGREWDKEAGLHYYRARYYDPMDGRFVSKDPISFAGGDVNLYGYVQNNPINLTDPLGLVPPIGVLQKIWSGLKNLSTLNDAADIKFQSDKNSSELTPEDAKVAADIVTGQPPLIPIPFYNPFKGAFDSIIDKISNRKKTIDSVCK